MFHPLSTPFNDPSLAALGIDARDDGFDAWPTADQIMVYMERDQDNHMFFATADTNLDFKNIPSELNFDA